MKQTTRAGNGAQLKGKAMQSPITIIPRAAAVKPLAPRLDEPAKPLEWITLEDTNGRHSSLAIHGRPHFNTPGYFHVVGNLEHGAQVKLATPADAAKLADFVTGGQFSALLAVSEAARWVVSKAYLRDGKHEDFHVHPALIAELSNALASVRGEKEAV